MLNTFWFTKANELMARYDKTNHAEEAMIKITASPEEHMPPELHDEDMQGRTSKRRYLCLFMAKTIGLLAIIRLHNDVAWFWRGSLGIPSCRAMIQRQYSTS
ncbi:hypothetical protein R1flu_011897 [Riccia fluitans]|uniref:Uncharacterized protein n=1 Tax=Riccia fluitans TaxID=41844 RepID=A0ABD1Z923_9MARC